MAESQLEMVASSPTDNTNGGGNGNQSNTASKPNNASESHQSLVSAAVVLVVDLSPLPAEDQAEE